MSSGKHELAPENTAKTVNFLVYASRSGSTYLGSLLDCYQDVAVSLESKFIYYLLKRDPEYCTDTEIDASLDYFYSDERSAEWNLDREELRRRLVEALPMNAVDLMSKLLAMVFEVDKPAAQFFVFKGLSSNFMGRLIDTFPAAKVIFVYRDGRAVYASQKKSKAPYSGRVHSTNPITTAAEWVGWFDAIDQIEARGAAVYRVKYEEMILDVEGIVPLVHQFLAGRDTPDLEVSFDTISYAKQIPSAQSEIHKNVKSAPLKGRIDGWKRELPAAEVGAFEKVAGKELRKYGYPVGNTKSSNGFFARLAYLWFRGKLLAEGLRRRFGS